MIEKIKSNLFFLIFVSLFLVACNGDGELSQLPPRANQTVSESPEAKKVTPPKKESSMPNLQVEILSEKNSKTDSPIKIFDFRNYSYPLPRGWQDRDSKEVLLEDGFRQMTEDRIGMSYVITKYGEVTGDEFDEAFVILKVETGGWAIPQLVYVFEQKDVDEEPKLLWHFRTGDRAQGGLKNIFAEDGELIIELFGRDRYIFGEMETSKIVGDEQQICCPTHFTRNNYKKEGERFVLKGDRWTYSLEDKNAPPVKNMNEVKLEKDREPRK